MTAPLAQAAERPAVAPASITATLGSTIALQRQTTGTYYIDGELKGYGPLKMLVDTGSSFLVIDEAMLNALKKQGAATYSHDLEGVMANGERNIIPLYRLAGVRLGDNCWVSDVEAAVFPQASRPILGMNVLTRLAPFTFTADPPAIALNQCMGDNSATIAQREPVKADAAMVQKAAPAPTRK